MEEAKEEKEEEAKEEEEKDTPAAEEEKDAAKAEEPKKKRWITYKRNPPHHPTAPGVKAQKEHEKVQDKRDNTIQKVMAAVKKIGSQKTDIHKPKSKKADKIMKESPDGVKRLPTGNCYTVI